MRLGHSQCPFEVATGTKCINNYGFHYNNNRWQPVIAFIAGMLISHLWGAGADIWRGFFEGTIYGKVVMKNGDADPQQIENVKILWNAGSVTKQCVPRFY